MGAFKSKKIINGNPSRIPYIAEEIRRSFMSEGFEVRIVDPNKGNEIYITKGGLFKAALGLRSALKVIMKPNREDNIDFEAGISIVKQQLIPTILTVCVFSPVVIAQILRQAKADMQHGKAGMPKTCRQAIGRPTRLSGGGGKPLTGKVRSLWNSSTGHTGPCSNRTKASVRPNVHSRHDALPYQGGT